MNTATVSMAVTPTVLSTFLSHYLNRKPLRQRPTAHLSYDEGLHLIRSFLSFASHHTVEDLQAFTSQWVPHPQWVKVDEVKIPEDKLLESAGFLQEQLGPEGIRQVGGKNWWQWRQPDRSLKAEWVEMRSDYNERKKNNDDGKRVMLYVHGGAYFFGSIDEHRYQLQRHARKLKARVLAPEYRLAPQFPFPCGLQDCLATYLYLLTTNDPTTIVLAGDSAGGGMIVSMLVTMRDRGIPLPAGAILISPWVDLTHSFPSVAGDCPLDYIPQCGFHHKPSKAWPPLNADELAILKEQISKNTKPGQTKLIKPASVEMKRLSQDLNGMTKALNGGDEHSPRFSAENTYLSINIDGKDVQLKDQIQMYATNELLSHPLVSPVMQPSLGGLPPLLIMTGGGEILRDEQIYLAHKCANPAKYLPGESHMDESARDHLARFKPTDVQLQVWDDLCHVAPTLSFTRPAKFMYRSISQFGAWALARAQKTDIEILDDDDISFISSSGSDSEDTAEPTEKNAALPLADQPQVGKAGDPLPPFQSHMIRQRVNRHGVIRALEPETELPACTLKPSEVGVIKEGPVRKWLETRQQWDNRYGSARAKIHKQRLKEMMAGYEGFDGEHPPPSALAGRRKTDDEFIIKRKIKSKGMALWSLWGSKHDEMTINREERADQVPEVKVATAEEGEGARSTTDLKKQGQKINKRLTRKSLSPAFSRSRSRTKIVKDEHQIADEDVDENNPVEVLLAKREEKAKQEAEANAELLPSSNLLTPNYIPAETGTTGKRPYVEGIAVPFSLKKEADTASMLTLTSNVEQPSRVASPRPMSPEIDVFAATSAAVVALKSGAAKDEVIDHNIHDTNQSIEPATIEAVPAPAEETEAVSGANGVEDETQGQETPRAASPEPKAVVDDGPTDAKTAEDIRDVPSPLATPMVTVNGEQRPPLETFFTAQEDLPRAH
ncbi:alpha/beta-hydrolase [Xylariaceae sp. FL0016]|nr:alpha/beta-hydrolase [Xylariaceae sp. FL0016]